MGVSKHSRSTVRVIHDVTVCIGCGCDDNHACENGCSWFRNDPEKGRGVCSECPDLQQAFDEGRRRLSNKAAEEVRMREEFDA